jgi:hypothetical protein
MMPSSSCDDRLSRCRARPRRDGRDSGGPDQVKPTFRSKCPSLRLSTPPPAQCTMNASKMMARITTTTQKKNTMMPGMAYPAMVLALATAASYPPPPDLFSLFGGFCRARKEAGRRPAGTATSSRTRHRASPHRDQGRYSPRLRGWQGFELPFSARRSLQPLVMHSRAMLLVSAPATADYRKAVLSQSWPSGGRRTRSAACSSTAAGAGGRWPHATLAQARAQRQCCFLPRTPSRAAPGPGRHLAARPGRSRDGRQPGTLTGHEASGLHDGILAATSPTPA